MQVDFIRHVVVVGLIPWLVTHSVVILVSDSLSLNVVAIIKLRQFSTKLISSLMTVWIKVKRPWTLLLDRGQLQVIQEIVPYDSLLSRSTRLITGI